MMPGWEEEMSIAAKTRALVREAERLTVYAEAAFRRDLAILDIEVGDRGWLHGWPLVYGGYGLVLKGSRTHCAGCGQVTGVATVIRVNWMEQRMRDSFLPDPDWPYSEDECPVCWVAPP